MRGWANPTSPQVCAGQKFPGGPHFPLETGVCRCSRGPPSSPALPCSTPPTPGSGWAAQSMPCMRTGQQSRGWGACHRDPQPTPVLTWPVCDTYPNYHPRPGSYDPTNMNNQNEINDNSMWAMLWREASDEQFTQEAANHCEESHWALGEGAGDGVGPRHHLGLGYGFSGPALWW